MAKAFDKRQYDVFLSHAHDDAAFAQKVRDWLEYAGLAVWFDRNAMAAGQRIDSKLQECIVCGRRRNLRETVNGRTRRPPFMLQAAGQFDTYKNDLERMALIVKLASEFRRKVYYG